MRKKYQKPKVYGTGVVQLDPMDCGSTIAYSIVRTTHGNFNANVDLSDCSRKISWYFDKTDLPKINTAIEILEKFRNDFIKAIKRKKS